VDAFAVTEHGVRTAVLWLRLVVEAMGALVVAVGVAVAAWRLTRLVGRGRQEHYQALRLGLARSLALALEFQLAADILSTAVAPTWEQIGQLAAVAVIRTGLNHFLTKEMQMERGPAAPA
jgi:uncharacterized membrane protein